jgi:hypothetical protein
MQLTHFGGLTGSPKSARAQVSDAAIEENAEPKFPSSIKNPNVSLQSHLSNEIRSFSHSPARRCFFALYFNRLP